MNPDIRERLLRVRTIPALERASEIIRSLSPGDRVIFYLLAALMSAASIYGLYSLQQSLLVKVPSYGGTLTEGVLGSPRFINPLLAISDVDRDLSTLTYAGLMGISGTGELVPVIAETFVISDDEKEYTFTIRRGAKFSDGSPITAEDVVFTVQKAQNSALKSPKYADWYGVGVTAIDHQTVKFTLNKPYVPFLGLTTLGILPSRLWENMSVEEFPFSTLQTHPIGAGPFKVTDISRGESGLIESILLVSNQHYVLGRPYLDSIRFNFYSRGADLISAIRDGSVESSYDVPTQYANNNRTSQIMTAPYARIFGVFWNPSEKQVYAQKEIRKALSFAIDRQGIIDTVLGGYATAIMGPIPPGGGLVQQTPVPKFENPTAAAADILQSAGWSYDGSLREWRNDRIKQSLNEITISTSNVPELRSVASAVKSDLEKLGIPVNIELYEQGDLSQNVIRPRKYEALLYGMIIGRDQDLYAFWDSKKRNDPGLNIALYANKSVDALLENVRSFANKNTRLKNIQKIENEIAADYPAAFIYAPSFVYVIPEDLHGVSLPQIIVPADRFASVSSWYRFTDSVWPFFANKDR